MDASDRDEVEVAPRFLPKVDPVPTAPPVVVASGSNGAIAFISQHKVIIICVVIIVLVMLVVYFMFISPPQKLQYIPTPPNEQLMSPKTPPPVEAPRVSQPPQNNQPTRGEREAMLQSLQNQPAPEPTQPTQHDVQDEQDDAQDDYLDDTPAMLAAEEERLSQLAEAPTIVDQPITLNDQTVSSTQELKQCAQILTNGAQCRKKTRDEFCPTHAR